LFFTDADPIYPGFKSRDYQPSYYNSDLMPEYTRSNRFFEDIDIDNINKNRNHDTIKNKQFIDTFLTSFLGLLDVNAQSLRG
jgi:hypothetical protein